MLSETIEAVERIQRFDATGLARSEDLGKHFEMPDAVEPAKKLIRLYRQLSVSALEDFPDAQLGELKKQADADYNRFQQALDFTPGADPNQNPAQRRDALVKAIADAYAAAFPKLQPFITYSASKAADFKRLETEARATLQAVQDEANKITANLATHEENAQRVLEDVRRVAAEQGVSQQAIYFGQESDEHKATAEVWQKRTVGWAIALGIYAAFSVFLHKFPFLAPANTAEAIQLVASKILIFFVLAYMLTLSARNFLNHKHNQIVNKHRQNALMTFKALADAANDTDAKDVVLNHASSCIFSPQDTGYIKASTAAPSESRPIIGLLPRTTMRPDDPSP